MLVLWRRLLERATADKSVFGTPTSDDFEQAKKMVGEAVATAVDPGRLMEAADLLEEAINKAPELRDQYESQLKLWRRGVCM